MVAREGLVIRAQAAAASTALHRPAGGVPMHPTASGAPISRAGFATGDGTRIDPLTISDAHSRYLLRCQAVEKTDTARVQAIFEAAFREYGMPEAIRSDNGAPFASHAPYGIVPLVVMVAEARHSAGTHSGRPSRTERAARAHASHPQTGNCHHPPAAQPRMRNSVLSIASVASTTSCVPMKRWPSKPPHHVYVVFAMPVSSTFAREVEYPSPHSSAASVRAKGSVSAGVGPLCVPHRRC